MDVAHHHAAAGSEKAAAEAGSGSGEATQGETAAGGAASKLYHYTSADPESIMQKGLLPGTAEPGEIESVYLTPNGELSPIQAHIELGLPGGRGYPGHLFEIDAEALAERGYRIPAATRVAGNPAGGAGGGWEVAIPNPIPADLLRLIR